MPQQKLLKLMKLGKLTFDLNHNQPYYRTIVFKHYSFPLRTL